MTAPTALVLAARSFLDAATVPDVEGRGRPTALFDAALALTLAAQRTPEPEGEVVLARNLPPASSTPTAPLEPTDAMRSVRHACYVDDHGREGEVTERSMAAAVDEVRGVLAACLAVPPDARHATLRFHYDADRCWGDALVPLLRPLHELTRW